MEFAVEARRVEGEGRRRGVLWHRTTRPSNRVIAAISPSTLASPNSTPPGARSTPPAARRASAAESRPRPTVSTAPHAQGNHRTSARHGLHRDDAEVLLAREKQRACATEQLGELLVRYPARELHVGSRERLEPRLIRPAARHHQPAAEPPTRLDRKIRTLVRARTLPRAGIRRAPPARDEPRHVDRRIEDLGFAPQWRRMRSATCARIGQHHGGPRRGRARPSGGAARRWPRTYADSGHGKRPGGKYCDSSSHT